MGHKACFAVLLVIVLNISVFAQKFSFKPKYSTIIDTLKGHKLLQQCSRSTPGYVSNFWIITQTEKQLLEKNFKKIIDQTTDGCCITGSKIKNLKRYWFQYVGIVIKGKKYIYINALTYDKDDLIIALKTWQTEPLIACDGGTGAWGALFDIEDKSFSELSFNGLG